MFGRKKIKELEESIRIMQVRLNNLHDDLSNARLLRWCRECGKPYRVRYPHKQCPSCDDVVNKREQAKRIARECPDDVLKLKTKCTKEASDG